MYRAKVVELDGEGNAACKEACSGGELFQGKGPFLVYGVEDPSTPRLRQVGLQRRRRSSSVISVGEKEPKTAQRNDGHDKFESARS